MNPLRDLLDPQIDCTFKGFPHNHAPLRRSEIAGKKWRLLEGDLPLPLAVIKQKALQHNLSWMQRFAASSGLDLAPHGKTTMSPQIFKGQLDQGAWGLTFANVRQARIGISVGAQCILIANQVFAPIDLDAIQTLLRADTSLRVLFLIDGPAQLELIEAWFVSQAKEPALQPFEVLLEVGLEGGRTGSRSQKQAMLLAQRIKASASCELAGIECYEGLAATGVSAKDEASVASLMLRVSSIAAACDQQGLFSQGELIVSAGGSAIFDLVASRLRLILSRPIRALLRSGCYATHDHGVYKRMVHAVNLRLGCADSLHQALEVWAHVQSCPEPGLVILAVGKRDISYDIDLPIPLGFCKRGSRSITPAPESWRISALNDQHAYLRSSDDAFAALAVGDMLSLGISHPCTTFDKWRWMPVVDEDYVVCDAIVTHF